MQGLIPSTPNPLLIWRASSKLKAASNAHLGAERLELGHSVVERQDLGGADEGEVKRVEEEHEVFALEDMRVRLLRDIAEREYRAF